jgi:hypothetical protein
MRIWQAQVQAGGAVFTMLVLPDGQYPCAAEQLTHARLREGELRALVTENGGMVLDPTEFVNTSLSDRGLPSSALQVVPGIDYHFSPLAHQLMADFLVRWLQDRQTLPAH